MVIRTLKTVFVTAGGAKYSVDIMYVRRVTPDQFVARCKRTEQQQSVVANSRLSTAGV